MRNKYIIIGSLVLLVVLVGYLGYSLYALNEAHTAQTKELEKTTHRAKLLHQKYSTQKARTAAIQRAKLTVEGLKRQAEMKAEKLAQELEELKAAKNQVGEDVKDLKNRIADLEKTVAQWKSKFGDLTKKYRMAKKTIAERDNTIATLKDNISELESELQFAHRTRDRYLEHNRQMAATAQSILARYDKKGVFSESILNVEPFTQIKKVELEKLIQEYLDRIDDQVIRE